MRFHRKNVQDFSDWETHHENRIAHLQTGRALDIGVKFRLDDEPAFALRRVVNVITEAEQQQRCRQKHKPPHHAFHAAEARSQLRSQISVSYTHLTLPT